MSGAVDDLETLELVGSTQRGLVTTSQAQAAGVTRMRLSRLADRGTLRRIRHGVYALPSAADGPLQGLFAAWLATDSLPVGTKPTAVVSGQSAAVVHGLGDLLPPAYEFSTPVRRQTTQADVQYRTRDLAPVSDFTWVDGLPVTTVARTVKDLSESGTDQDHLANVVRDALSAGTTPSFLVQALDPRAEASGHESGQAYLVALLDREGTGLDPALTAALRNFSAAVAKSFAPQLHEHVTSMLEQLVRQSGLATAALDPESAARILASLSAQTEASGIQAVRALLANTLDPAGSLSRSSGVTLSPVAAEPGEPAAQGEGTDARTAPPGGGGPSEGVVEREAGSGGEASRRRG